MAFIPCLDGASIRKNSFSTYGVDTEFNIYVFDWYQNTNIDEPNQVRGSTVIRISSLVEDVFSLGLKTKRRGLKKSAQLAWLVELRFLHLHTNYRIRNQTHWHDLIYVIVSVNNIFKLKVGVLKIEPAVQKFFVYTALSSWFRRLEVLYQPV